MPNSANKKMDDKSKNGYEKILLDLKEKILGDIKKISSDASDTHKNTPGDVSGHALHMADVATDMYDREFSLGLASNDRELLYKIDEALHRLREGKFGLCTSCQGPITKERLKALPYTQTCLKCQEKIESK